MSNVSIETGLVIPLETEPVTDKFTAGGFKTGLTIKAKVRREFDDGVLDWGDMTFKPVGSVGSIFSAAFTEINAANFPGEYRFNFDPAAITNFEDNDVYQIRIEEVGSALAGNLPQFGQLRISKALDEAVRSRKLLQNKQLLLSGDTLNLVVYDDDKITILQRWNVVDESTGVIALPAGYPAARDPV